MRAAGLAALHLLEQLQLQRQKQKQAFRGMAGWARWRETP